MNQEQNQEKGAATNQGTSLEKVTNFANLADLEAFGNKIAESGLTPLKKGKEVVAAILYGKELGMEPMISVNNIFPINGKATLGIHLINALLLKAGIVTEIIRNYEPCVNFVLKGEDGKAILNDENGREIKRNPDGTLPQGTKGTPVIIREGFADEAAKDYEVKGVKITNFRTVVKMTRKVKQPDNSWKDMSVQASFSIQEAVNAGLVKDKSAWDNYPRQQTLNRALAFCGRLIGADVTLGLYETSEMADVHNIPYVIQGDKVSVIQDENNDKKGTNSNNEPNITDAVEVKHESGDKETTSENN